MFYTFMRKVLFQLDPEYAHDFLLQKLNFISKTPLKYLMCQKVPEKPVTCMGLTFKNPVGLAAGLDKNGKYVDMFGLMGFGFIEIGTVTPHPQSGNDKPRLFRLMEVNGLINRMGFNNLGVDHLINTIKKVRFDGVLGISIGKNKNTPIEKGKIDYLICMEKIYIYADYIVVNISSPNTPNLRLLQYGRILDDLLMAIKNKQRDLQKKYHKYVPIAVKIDPDLSTRDLNKITDSLIHHDIDGVIATNTTLDRSLIQGMKHCNEMGGLSGRPIHLRSTEVIRRLSEKLNGRLPIIGVGGIDSVISAREKIDAGASIVQIYSGFIFHGPKLVKEIVTYI